MIAGLQRMPVLPAAAGIIIGVLLWTAGANSITAIIAALVAVILFFFKYFYTGATLLAMSLGWIAASLHAPVQAPADIFSGNARNYIGRVENVSGSATSATILLRVDSVDNRAVEPFNAELRGLPGGALPAKGDIVTGNLTLSLPDCYHDIPGERDPSLYYLRHGIVATDYAEPEDLSVIGHTEDFSSWMAGHREAIISRLAHSGLNDSTFALLAALLTGYDDELPPATTEAFRLSGVAHALALSGFHAGIIILLVSVALYPLRLWPRLRVLRFLLSIVLLWFYAAFTGFPLSVVRAVFMMSVYLLGLAAGRASNPPNSLCAAILVIVAASPFSVFSEGLQLSVAAVIGIIVFARPLNFVSPRRHLLYKTIGILTLPVAALLGTLPITAMYFHTMPLLFPISNLVISLAMPVWMFGGIFLLLTGSAFSATVLNQFTRVVNQLIEWLATVPGGHLDGLSSTPITAPLMVAITIAMAIALYHGGRRSIIAVLIVALLLPIVSFFLKPKIQPTEVILARHDFTTALLLRSGNKLTVIDTSTPRGRDGNRKRMTQRLEGYTTLRSIDSIIYFRGNFEMAPFSRSEEIVNVNGRRVAIPSVSSKNVTISRDTADLILVGKCFRGRPESLLTNYQCDTILLGTDLSPSRSKEISGVAGQAGCVVIDLRPNHIHF